MLADGGGLSFLEGEKMWIWDDWKNKPYLDLKCGDVFVLNFNRKVTKLLWIIFLSWRAHCCVCPFKCPRSIVLRCISLSEGHGFVRTRTRNSTFLISAFPVRSNRFHPHSSFNIKWRSNRFHPHSPFNIKWRSNSFHTLLTVSDVQILFTPISLSTLSNLCCQQWTRPYGLMTCFVLIWPSWLLDVKHQVTNLQQKL